MPAFDGLEARILFAEQIRRPGRLNRQGSDLLPVGFVDPDLDPASAFLGGGIRHPQVRPGAEIQPPVSRPGALLLRVNGIPVRGAVVDLDPAALLQKGVGVVNPGGGRDGCFGVAKKIHE